MLGLRFCARAFSSCGERASHGCGLSRCGAQAPDAQAQYLWLTGLVAPRHVGSSQTRARTRAPPHRQADSQPLRHQGSPSYMVLPQFIQIYIYFLPKFYYYKSCGNVFPSIWKNLFEWEIPRNRMQRQGLRSLKCYYIIAFQGGCINLHFYYEWLRVLFSHNLINLFSVQWGICCFDIYLFDHKENLFSSL